MNELIELGKVIRNKRLSLNLRMDDVALKCGITRATLSRIENGKATCSVNTLFKICHYLNLSLKLGDSNESNEGRKRATRLNSALDKKINRFLIMCVELYSQETKENSRVIYQKMKEKGIINNIIEDYEDLHGMSFEYMNYYIGKLLSD